MKRPVKTWKRIVLGALAATAAYAALCGLLSLLIVQGRIGEDWIAICVPAAVFLAALVGAIAAGGPAHRGVELGIAAVFCIAAMILGLIAGASVEPGRAAILSVPILLGTFCAVRIRRGKGRTAKRRSHSRK